MRDVTEMDLKELLKSYTFSKWQNKVGRCTRCQEMTDILYSCCDAPVSFEGSNYCPDIIWGKVSSELQRVAEPDYDAEAKDKI